jgi:rhamnosyltransferase
MPRCSVVIRACNEEKYIGRLLTGLLRQAQRDVEILLVDSGSTDATVAIAARYPVRVLHIAKEDFTFGRSLNLGIAHATSELVVMASAHVYPLFDDWIDRLLAPFSDPRVGVVYGKQRGNEITRYSEHRVFEQWFPDAPSAQQGHPFCNNANAAVRRALWERLRYDETVTGLEDLEFAKRVQEQGSLVVYVPEAVVAHVHEETPARIYNRYRREAIALAKIYPDEHFHFRDFLRLFVGNVVSDAHHARDDGALWTNLPSIVSFRLMQFLGTYHGFATRGPVSSELLRKFYFPSRGTRRSQTPATGRRIEYSE